MAECICNGCKNLKMVMNDENEEGEFDCEFGYPSDNCEECEADECEETCEHFESDEEEDETVIVHCSRCGKELSKVIKDDEEGDILCVDCFLKG